MQLPRRCICIEADRAIPSSRTPHSRHFSQFPANFAIIPTCLSLTFQNKAQRPRLFPSEACKSRPNSSIAASTSSGRRPVPSVIGPRFFSFLFVSVSYAENLAIRVRSRHAIFLVFFILFRIPRTRSRSSVKQLCQIPCSRPCAPAVLDSLIKATICNASERHQLIRQRER